MSDIFNMAARFNLAARVKQDLTALTRMGELQGQFTKAWVSAIGNRTLLKFGGVGPNNLESFFQHACANDSFFPGLPSAVILKADLPNVSKFLKEDAVCELLVHDPEVFLVTFPCGHKLAMVNSEVDLASCKPSNETIPEPPALTNEEVNNDTKDVSSEPVEPTSISEPEHTNSADIQSSASNVQPADSNISSEIVEQARVFEPEPKDSANVQPAESVDLSLELEAATSGSVSRDDDAVHSGLTPIQEDFFFLCPEMEASILEAEAQADLAAILASTPPHETTDNIVQQASTPSYPATNSNDQAIIPSIEFDSCPISEGTAAETSMPASHVTLPDDFESSLGCLPEPALYGTPSSNFTSSADCDGATYSGSTPGFTSTPLDTIDGLSNNHEAPPSTPRLVPFDTPVTHATFSSDINGSSNDHGAVLSTPALTPFDTPSGVFETLSLSNRDETVSATPTPAPRSTPILSRSRSNGGLPTYGDMAKAAFYNYSAPDRPANMIKFDQIYQYAEETYPAIKEKGESYKSGFRHAVPKAFIKVPTERKPDSSLWWTLDLVNFPGDNSARNRRKRRDADLMPPETPSKRPRKKKDIQGNVQSPHHQSLGRQLVYGAPDVQQPVHGQQQGFFHPQQGGQQNHQPRVPQSVQQNYAPAQPQFQPQQILFTQQRSQQPVQRFQSQQVQQPAQQQLQSYQSHVDQNLQQYIDMKTHELAKQMVHQKIQQRLSQGLPVSALEESVWYGDARMGAKKNILASLGASH
ncbi:hypothetical protein IWX90DRAFT_501211 [Phyllosticta citrichinensis]|uniref:Fork-head domain-containing protein n=1 Tax=Phyllosticta citrichinensis TaxID=1130410 RepID=A0ABR1XVP7_9PEZI